MQLDTSVAPEIARLATAPAAATPAAAAPATVGSLAACLRHLEADPRGWWDLVRFDPARPVRITVEPSGPGCEAWLLVLPPGYRGDELQSGQRRTDEDMADHHGADQGGLGQGGLGQGGLGQGGLGQGWLGQDGLGQDGLDQDGLDQGWDVACLVAGAIAEQAGTPDGRPGRPFVPGRIRVRGGQEPRRLVNTGSGYAVSLHARSVPARPQS